MCIRDSTKFLSHKRNIIYKLYYNKIRVIGNSSLADRIIKLLNEIGYFIVNESENLRVVVGPLSRAIKFANKPVILVTENGEYVIPVNREESGVSLIASLISDMIGGNLILTSKMAEKGVYSVQEFSWVNGLYWTNSEKVKELNKKILKSSKLTVYYDKKIILPEGYSSVEKPCSADIVVGDYDCNSLVLKPYKVVMGLKYYSTIPPEVILYSIRLTLKSIYILNDRVDVIVSPVKDRNIINISTLLGAELFTIYGDTCESMLLQYGGKILLKGVKRAFGLETCLGVVKVEKGIQ